MKNIAILSAALIALGNDAGYVNQIVKQEYKPLNDFSPEKKAHIRGKTKKEKKLKKETRLLNTKPLNRI